MKKKSLILSILAIVAVLVVAAICWWRSGRTSHASVLPSDMVAVGCLDALEAQGTPSLPLDSLLARLPEGIDPANPGIDVLAPIYFFSSPQLPFAAVAALADADDFTANLEALKASGEVRMGEITQARGLTWVEVEQTLLAYDGEKVLLAAGITEQARPEMHRLMTQSEGESGIHTQLFDDLEELDGVLTITTHLGNLPAEATKPFSFLGIPPEEVRLAFSIDADKTTAHARAFVKSDNPAWVSYLDAQKKLVGRVDGSRLRQLPQDPDFLFLGHVNGVTLFEQLRPVLNDNFFLKMAQGTLDVETLVKAIDGDVAMAASGDIDDMDSMVLVFTAELGSDELLDELPKWPLFNAEKSMFPVKNLGDHRYSMQVLRESLYFGIADECLYFSNSELCANQIGGAAPEKGFVARSVSEIEDNYAYVMVNFGRQLETFLKKNRRYTRDVPPEAIKMLKSLDRLIVTVPELSEVHLELRFVEGAPLW